MRAIESRGPADPLGLAAAPENAPRSLHLDFALLRKIFFGLGAVVVLMAPFARDPLITAACGALPFALVSILDRTRMPSIVLFYLMFMWLEIAARVVLTYIDEEALGDGFYGPDVCPAAWYAMASLIVLATVFRLHLGRAPASTGHQFDDHLRWSPRSVFQVYLLTVGLAFALAPLARLSPGLAQPLQALASVKWVAIFALFATVLSVHKGLILLMVVVLIEIVVGFTGLFSEFKQVLIVVLLSALSVRITLRISTVVGIAAAVSLLLGLGVFWTAVKVEYRGLATEYSDNQVISASLDDRTGLLLEKALNPAEIEWGAAVERMIRRVAYIDFFGAVIGMVRTSEEEENFPRWRDTLEHVSKPRLLFPDKDVLDDTEVYLRYVRDEVGDERRPGTSISIGYLAENFIDFGFPLMLAPIALMGLLLSCSIRYFMTRPVPWVIREGFVTALILMLGTSMGTSLPKFLGVTIMATVVLGLCLKFFYPFVERWLDRQR